MHHPERERGVGARMDRDVPVGQFRGAGLVGVDDDKLRAVAPRGLDLRPEMDVVAMDVRAPGDDVAGVVEVFKVGADLAAVDGEESFAARL